MAGLVGIIEGIRGKEVTELMQAEGCRLEGDGRDGVTVSWGRREVVIDGSGEEESTGR